MLWDYVSLIFVQEWLSGCNLHWVDSPDDEREASNGSKELADLAALGHGLAASVDSELPDDDEVGNAGNSIPSPLLWCRARSEGSEEAGQDHDEISHHGDEDVSSVEASKQAQVEEEERRGDGPIDVTSPVDLTIDITGGVWDVLVGLAGLDVVQADTVTAGHGEVGAGGEGHDESGNDVIETLGLQKC